jgi:hypothetical protein
MQDVSTRIAGRHLVRTILIILAIFLVYAFAVQATNINLEKPLDPARQENVMRVLRLLADPDIVAVDADTGQWGLSEATRITIERIVETIFMALLASTVGTLLAVPVSFFAARNLMAPVTAPLAAIMAAIVAFPIGAWLTMQVASLITQLAETINSYSWLLAAGVLLVTILALWLLWRAGASTAVEEGASPLERTMLAVRIAGALLFLLLAIALLALLGLEVGRWLEDNLGIFGFLGNFIYITADFVRVFLPPLLALLGGLIAAPLWVLPLLFMPSVHS